MRLTASPGLYIRSGWTKEMSTVGFRTFEVWLELIYVGTKVGKRECAGV